MRSVICRFKDEADLFSHLDSKNDLSFLADFRMSLGREVQVTVMISNVRERVRLKMHAIDRVAMAVDDSNGVAGKVWAYRVRVGDEDRVWLESFMSKLHTIARINTGLPLAA